MSKTSMTLNEYELEFLMDAIHSYYEVQSKNIQNLKTRSGEKIPELSEMKYEETIFGVIDEKIYKALERCWKKPKNDIYEMTGGYLGDGVYITEDGCLYEN